MALNDDLKTLEGAARDVDALGDSLIRAQGAAVGLRKETRAIGVNAERLAHSFSADFGRAFDTALFRGGKLSDMLRGLALDLSGTAARAALQPAQDALGGAMSNIFAGALNGATMFARGGVVGGPTAFSHPGGLGVMGEAGPEAILPLSRGPNGKLGVASQASAPAVNIYVEKPGPNTRVRVGPSSGQINSRLTRAADQGRRNL